MQTYVTRGTAYHVDAHCPLMLNGEALWDGDGEDYWHIMGSFRREVSGPQYAAMCGKWPCLHCVPAELRIFPPLYGQTFGHKPITGFIDGRGLTSVCARCFIPCDGRHIGCYDGGYRIQWPCMSAVVLGLVPRGGA